MALSDTQQTIQFVILVVVAILIFFNLFMTVSVSNAGYYGGAYPYNPAASRGLSGDHITAKHRIYASPLPNEAMSS